MHDDIRPLIKPLEPAIDFLVSTFISYLVGSKKARAHKPKSITNLYFNLTTSKSSNSLDVTSHYRYI